MLTLFHHPMSTGSRYARLILNEYDIEVELIEENSWARRKEFLALNPAGTLPVLLAEGDVPISGLVRDRRIYRRDTRRAETQPPAVSGRFAQPRRSAPPDRLVSHASWKMK